MTDEPNRDQSIRQYRSITHYIKEWRIFYQLSADKLGNRSELTGSYIAMLEKGRSNYTQRSLERIAAGLGVEPYKLLQGPPEKVLGDEPSIHDFDKQFWDRIPEEHHAHVTVMFNCLMDAAKACAKKTALEMFAERPWPERRRRK